MKKIGIYKITSPTGGIYIGQSSNIEKRKKDYIKLNCKQQIKLYNSLNKYGFDAHKFDIIEECNVETLNERESFWIIECNSFVDVNDKGMNLTKGGDKGIISLETKRKISEKNIGTKKPKTKEFGEKVSLRLLGNKYGAKPKHSKEFKNKFSESLKGNTYRLGQKLSDEAKLKQALKRNKYKKKIYCLELNQEFGSISEASKELNINIMTISNIINNKRKTKFNLTFILIK